MKFFSRCHVFDRAICLRERERKDARNWAQLILTARSRGQRWFQSNISRPRSKGQPMSEFLLWFRIDSVFSIHMREHAKRLDRAVMRGFHEDYLLGIMYDINTQDESCPLNCRCLFYSAANRSRLSKSKISHFVSILIAEIRFRYQLLLLLCHIMFFRNKIVYDFWNELEDILYTSYKHEKYMSGIIKQLSSRHSNLSRHPKAFSVKQYCESKKMFQDVKN